MMRENNKLEFLYAVLVIGIVSALVGITGQRPAGSRFALVGDIRFTSVPDGMRWILLFAGVIITVLCILSIRKQKRIPPGNAEETARPAGETPVWTAAAQSPVALEEDRTVIVKRKIRQGRLLMLAGAVIFYAADNALPLISAVVLFLAGLARLIKGLMERS